jgi:type I restriction enzyme S subunit
MVEKKHLHKTTFDNICVEIKPGYPSGKHNDAGHGNLHFRPYNITSHGQVDVSQRKYVPLKSEEYIIKANDIIFNNTNSPELLGKTCLIKKETDWVFSNHMTRIRLKDGFLPSFYAKYLHYLKYTGYYKIHCSNHVNQASISSGFLKKNIQVPVIPLPEQRAIVAKIEQIFSELDNGIANLQKAQEQLKVYRQAVLQEAFEGELTKAWRAKQTDLPTAEELLEQIKEEREEISKSKGIKLKQFPSVEKNELAELPSLPKNWSWINLGNIFSNSPKNGLYKPASQYGEGTDIIRIDDFYTGRLIRNSGFKRVRLSDSEIEKYLVENGQLLINRVNSIEYLGKCGLVEKLSSPTVFESNIMKLEVLPAFVNPKYISFYLTSLLGIQEIRKNAKHAVNQASINQTDVSLTSVPITTIKEQNQVVQEIERRLSVCDKVEATIQESLEKAEVLRQSILKQAFEGKLLTKQELQACRQEPDWEPAEKLLERIKAEKATGGKVKKKKVAHEPAVS